MRSPIMLSLLLALGLAACSGVEPPSEEWTASESLCNTQFDCGKLGRETVAECVVRLDGGFANLRAQDDGGCAPVADAYEALYACLGGRTCVELAEGAEKGPCKSENEALEAASKSKEGRCDVK